MTALLLTVLCSSSIALILKDNHTREGNPLLLLAGNYFIDPSITYDVIQTIIAQPLTEDRATDRAYESLTRREQEILALLAEGEPLPAIAQRLFISHKTVENHRSNIFRKLGIKGSMELVRYAARIGLIDVDLWKK